MEAILDPKVDFIFKNLFGIKARKRTLISLLNAIISPYEGRDIVDAQIDNSVIRKEHLEDKYSILDIKATLDDDSRVNIEMQMTEPGHMTKRLLYYLSRLYTEQLSSGGEYKELRKTIVIGILNYSMLKNDRYISRFLLKEGETNEPLTDLLQVYLIELKKLDKGIAEIESPLEGWMEFLKEPKEEVVKMLSKQVPEIGEAYEVLKVVSRGKKTRHDYEIREKALKDRASSESWNREKGIEQGIEKGFEKAKIMIARDMLANGYSMEEILKLIKLSKEAVAEIQNEG